MPNKPKKDETFSSTEVGTLVEGLRSDFHVVAEEVRGLSNRVGALETDIHELKTDMKFVKDTVRVALPSLNRRVSALEAKIGV